MKITSNKSVGIKEITEKANVFNGPVDRVLHNRGRVSEITKNNLW